MSTRRPHSCVRTPSHMLAMMSFAIMSAFIAGYSLLGIVLMVISDEEPRSLLHGVLFITYAVLWAVLFGGWALFAAWRWSQCAGHLSGTAMLLTFGTAILIGVGIAAAVGSGQWEWPREPLAVAILILFPTLYVFCVTTHVAAMLSSRRQRRT